jgi:hypothetical protein
MAFALAGLTEQRLRNAGFQVASHAHGLGYSLEVPLDSAQRVTRFIDAAVLAISTPVATSEALAPARARAQHVRGIHPGQDVTVDLCSGDAQQGPGQVILSDEDRLARQQIEAWRKQQTAESTALALVGPSRLLSDAQDALEDSAELSGAPNPRRDPWPSKDSVAFSSAGVEGSRLSVALRVADTARALAVAPQLRSDALLGQMLAALDTPWSIERVTAVARPRGACLRIDLHSASDAPDAAETGRLARWLADYAVRMPASSSSWIFQDAIASHGDATNAARAAAWLALVRPLPAGPPRTAIRLELPPGRALLGETFAAHTRAVALNSVPIAERTAFEPGHTTLSMLIASPCGTAGETSRDAGKKATMLTALAAASTSSDFTVLPWITTDALGLLVQSRAQSASETGKAHAERSARRLALALLSPLDGALTANARQSILSQLTGPEPDLQHLLAVLSNEQPAALEPRGSWTSVGALVHDEIDAARHAFVGEPLRVAVLANQSPTQGAELVQELSRLIAPLRTARSECPAAPALAPNRFGQWHLEPSSAPRAPALVAVPLPGVENALGPSEAEWLAYLFNRAGGWLEQYLLTTRLVTAATARIWGGRRGRALIIELFAPPEQVDTAIEKTRTLLHDLSRGAVLSQGDVAAASQFFQNERIRLYHDRRQRIVSLWRGAGPSTPLPSLVTLQRYQAAFAQDRHLVVVSEPTN